eukprot:4841857-Prymnesium_polylepis.2
MPQAQQERPLALVAVRRTCRRTAVAASLATVTLHLVRRGAFSHAHSPTPHWAPPLRAAPATSVPLTPASGPR